jgi:hypothetical protein
VNSKIYALSQLSLARSHGERLRVRARMYYCLCTALAAGDGAVAVIFANKLLPEIHDDPKRQWEQ